MASMPRTSSSSFIPAIPPIFFKRRAAAAAPAKGGVDFDKLLAATRKAPVDLAPIEWEGDLGAATAGGADPPPAREPDPSGVDVRTRRIRDRYIGARFPGAVRGEADLENAERVVKSARLYFEDGRLDHALELLDMAIEQDSKVRSLWLAELEILYLASDAARFVQCARAFRALNQACDEWPEVCRLGRALVPAERLFGDKRGPRNHEHYGPWPDLPNWIQANWDLTAEVLAADFHRLLKQRAASARAARAKPLAA